MPRRHSRRRMQIALSGPARTRRSATSTGRLSCAAARRARTCLGAQQRQLAPGWTWPAHLLRYLKHERPAAQLWSGAAAPAAGCLRALGRAWCFQPLNTLNPCVRSRFPGSPHCIAVLHAAIFLQGGGEVTMTPLDTARRVVIVVVLAAATCGTQARAAAAPATRRSLVYASCPRAFGLTARHTAPLPHAFGFGPARRCVGRRRLGTAHGACVWHCGQLQRTGAARVLRHGLASARRLGPPFACKRAESAVSVHRTARGISPPFPALAFAMCRAAESRMLAGPGSGGEQPVCLPSGSIVRPSSWRRYTTCLVRHLDG